MNVGAEEGVGLAGDGFGEGQGPGEEFGVELGEGGGVFGARGIGGAGFCALEGDLAVDQGEFDAGEGVEGVAVEEGDIGVLADFEGADAGVESKLLGGVDGDHGEGVGFGDAVFHHFGGFEVQVASELLAIAFDADRGAGFVQEGGVLRDGVLGFDLVGVPV